MLEVALAASPGDDWVKVDKFEDLPRDLKSGDEVTFHVSSYDDGSWKIDRPIAYRLTQEP